MKTVIRCCLYCAMDHAYCHTVFRRLEMPMIGSLKTVHLMEKEDNSMFHPDPEVQQIKGQLQSANSYLTMVSRKKR